MSLSGGEKGIIIVHMLLNNKHAERGGGRGEGSMTKQKALSTLCFALLWQFSLKLLLNCNDIYSTNAIYSHKQINRKLITMGPWRKKI